MGHGTIQTRNAKLQMILLKIGTKVFKILKTWCLHHEEDLLYYGQGLDIFGEDLIYTKIIRNITLQATRLQNRKMSKKY